MDAIVVRLPKKTTTAIDQIDDIFKKVKSNNLEILIESTTVSKEDLKEYSEIVLKQFSDLDEQAKNMIKKIKFEENKATSFKRNQTASGGLFSITLIKSEKFEKKGDTKYKIDIFYYKRSVEYPTLTSIKNNLFGIDKNKNYDDILTEDNVHAFLLYKLAKQASCYDNNLQIVFE